MSGITTADKIIIAGAILSIIAVYSYFWRENTSVNQLEILVDGEKRYVYDLLADKQVSIEGKLGNSIIEINEGKARFIESPCNTKFCIHSGWLNKNKRFIACLPNGVSVHLSSDGAVYDAINF